MLTVTQNMLQLRRSVHSELPGHIEEILSVLMRKVLAETTDDPSREICP